MSDSNQTSPLEADAPAAPPYAPPPVPAYAGHEQPPAHESGPRFWDRVVGMRGGIAVALACVVLGGAGGAALGANTFGGDGFGGRVGPRAFPGGRPGQPGQFQPGQPGQFQQGQIPQQGGPQGQAPNGG